MVEVIVTQDENLDVGVEEGIVSPTIAAEANHALLLNRDKPDQHTIDSITGLRAELDKMNALGNVSANQKNHAEYYLWQDGNVSKEARTGFFITICEDTDQIAVCDGGDGTFGVTVDSAAFISNQADTARDYKYGLVVRSGVVPVRCEADVQVGDYVVSNASGRAKRVERGYGCKVLSLQDIDGIAHAVVSLPDSIGILYKMSSDASYLGERMDKAETNIVSAINTANEAYELAKSGGAASDELSQKVDDAINKADSAIQSTEDLKSDIQNANQTAKQAEVIANSASTHAETVKNEAIATANEALAKAENISSEFTSLVVAIDKHSVGEYSQAYNLTMEQAVSILQKGMIYVPTKHADSEGGSHSETYAYADGSQETQWFTPTYHYIWNGMQWTESENPSVCFSATCPVATEQYIYWYSGNDVTDEKYDARTLYLFKDGAWVAVATLSGNYTVSLIHQESDKVTVAVTDMNEKIAALDVRVDEESSKIATVVNADGGVNAAIIIEAINNDKSGVLINADHVVIEGSTTFLTQDSVGPGGSTVIDGGRITSGKISAEYIDADNLHVKAANIDGTLTVNHIDATSGTIGGIDISTSYLSAGGELTKSSTFSADMSHRDGLTKIYNWGDGWTNEVYNITGKSAVYINDWSSTRGYSTEVFVLSAVPTGDTEDYTITTHFHHRFVSTDDVSYQVTNTSSETRFLIINRSPSVPLVPFVTSSKSSFKMSESGSIECNHAKLEGEIIAKSGYIGNGVDGFKIESTGLYSESRSSFLPGTPPSIAGVYIGTAAGRGSDDCGGISLGAYYTNDVYYEQFLYAGKHVLYGQVGSDAHTSTILTSSGLVFKYIPELLTRDQIDLDDDVTGQIATIGTTSSCAVLGGTWKSASTIEVSSARNAKTDIEALNDKHTVLFDNLIPRQFKYADGQSDRIHYGLIVDELRDAMDTAGLAPEECAAYCLDDPNNPDGNGGIRYSELLALCIKEIQALKQEIEELKENK